MPSAGEVCNRDVVVAQRSTSIVEAAVLMRDHHVGDVVVVEHRNDLRVPVGLLTDRDIVVGVLARVEPYVGKLTVGDVLTRGAVVAEEKEDVVRVVKRMRSEGVRRVPVVDHYGGLVGILAMDDVLALVADTLLELSSLTHRQRDREEKRRH